MVGLSVVFALASATSNAASAATQHRAASKADPHGSPAELIRFLLGRPDWIIAILLGPVGLTLHLLALNHGPISLVQPIVILGIVFAIPFRSAWDRRWPRPKELAAVAVTAGAIAALLVVSNPQEASTPPPPTDALYGVLACDAAAILAIYGARSVRNPTRRAFLLGSAAGVTFGVMAVLMEASTTYADQASVGEVFTTWLPYLLVANGLAGVVVNQVAFRAGRLSASMPVLNVVNCLLTLGFGYLVFHEQPRDGVAVFVVGALAIAVMAAGLTKLARYEEHDEAQHPEAPVGAARVS